MCGSWVSERSVPSETKRERKEISLVNSMHMQYGLAARGMHHDRIEAALRPRPEWLGPIPPRPSRVSFAALFRIGRLVRWPALLTLRLTSRRA